MIRINGELIPEVKRVGKYDLKEVRNNKGGVDLEVYEGDQYVIGFTSTDIRYFDTEAEIDDEILAMEEETYWDNEPEGRMARAGW